MAKKFRELYDKMSPRARAEVEKRVAKTIAEMPLGKLRKARSMTQAAMAKRLKIDQGSVSKIEGRTDMYLSTLREYIEALGGTLEIRAEFPEGAVNIDLDAATTTR